MKNLLEISKIVTKKKVKKIEIFDDYNLKNNKSKFNEFYENLSLGVYKNDRDAAANLYDCSPKDARYRQLKSRFRRRLLNTLFFLDVNKPSASNYDRAHFTCHKEWTLVKILQDNDAHNSAIHLARSILTTALKFRISEIIVNCTRILRKYAAIESKAKEFEEYDTMLKKFEQVLDAEIRSEELYQRVVMDYFRPLHEDNDLNERISIYGNTLLSLSETYDSPTIYYNLFLVWAMRYEMNREYKAQLEVCDQAESYIANNPAYYQEEKLISFYTKKMSAFLHLGDYTKGQINAEKCLQRFPEGSAPWFSFMEYYLLIALHTNHHIQALAIYNRTASNKAFAKLDSLSKDKWGLYEAFIYYILLPKKLADRIAVPKKRRKFQVDRFIEQQFNFHSDQRIFTLLYTVLQVLFLVERKDYNKVDERIDQLQNMANRTLHKEQYFRSIQFIRLLLQLRKADYQVEDLRNTDKYLLRLSERQFSYRGVLSQLEPLSYEQLWEMILTRLT